MFDFHHKFAVIGRSKMLFNLEQADNDWIDDILTDFQKSTDVSKVKFRTICSYVPNCTRCTYFSARWEPHCLTRKSKICLEYLNLPSPAINRTRNDLFRFAAFKFLNHHDHSTLTTLHNTHISTQHAFDQSNLWYDWRYVVIVIFDSIDTSRSQPIP